MSDRSGRCFCGGVQYRIAGDPLFTRVCWCRDCQYMAANGTVNIAVASSELEVSGEMSEYVSTADSGNQITRRFCPKCGTHLFANSSARPQFTIVRVGTLDEPSSVKPESNIWTTSAPQWACFDSSLPAIEKQPPAPSRS